LRNARRSLGLPPVKMKPPVGDVNFQWPSRRRGGPLGVLRQQLAQALV